MRAWTIVLFIVSLHAVLAMLSGANIQNSMGYNYTFDTTSHSGFVQIPGTANVSLPSSDPHFFDSTKNGSDVVSNGTFLDKKDFASTFIESTLGLGATLMKFIGMVGAAIFTIHTLSAPYFGDTTAWILEGMVDMILGVALFQMVTGRAFKVME